MSSAMVTAFLFTVVLLVIGSFVLSAWSARRRHLRWLAGRKKDEPATTTGQMAMIVLMDGSVVGVENRVAADVTNRLPAVVPSAHLSHEWYTRRRMVVSLGMLCMLAVALLMQTGVASDAFQKLAQEIHLSVSQLSGVSLQAAFQPLPDTASARIIRVDSAARNQYYTDYQYQVWSFASCSGISLEEVMNSYGSHYIAADVLQEEQKLGIWDTYNGLTGGAPGMARAAAYFGYTISANPPTTLQDLLATANKGQPVIVGIPGHILVVKGGDANNVYLVDSAPVNRKVMTHEQFLNIWTKFSVVVTPK